MTDITVRRTIPASADAVWSDLRSFGGVERFLGMIERSEVRGSGVGATRICTTHDGGRLVEKLEELDDDARTLVYTIQEAPMPFENYRSTMQVVGAGTGSSTVTWSCTFDAAPEAAGELEATMRGVYEGGLEGLEALYANG